MSSDFFLQGLPVAFCKRHLPDKDTTIVLEDESGKEYNTKFIACKMGLSAGWRQFSAVHKLQEGDAVVFQLVGPTKFKVMVFIFLLKVFKWLFTFRLEHADYVAMNKTVTMALFINHESLTDLEGLTTLL